MNLRWMLIFFTLLLNPWGLSPTYADDTLEQQRNLFWQAQQALENEQLEQFQVFLKQLDDYPLTYYLRYQYLKSHLHFVLPKEIKAFFNSYPASALSKKLRYDWLAHLSREGRWAQFIADYRPSVESTVLQCRYVMARLQRGETHAEVLNAARKLWTVGKSQPKACDPVFDYLYEHVMDDDLIWQRLRLAMLKGKTGLAKFLAKRLNDEKLQNLYAVWLQVRQKPLQSLEGFAEPDSDVAQEIIYQGITRLARKDLENAQRLWRVFSQTYAFNASEKAAMQRELTLRSAWSDAPNALQQLKALKTAQLDKTVRQVFLQYALLARDWHGIVNLIQRFPSEAQDQPQWRYWEARALEQTGKAALAKTLYQDVAKERDFYGFLAADRLGQSYALNHKKVDLTPKQIEQLYQKHPALARAHEFYHLGMKVSAGREWRNEIPFLSQAELIQAAALARQWCWYNRAIFTAAKAQYYDDLEMRFPLAYFSQLMAGTEEQELDMAWAYGIMRQESAFAQDVTSHAGAMGLMQLMPATGRAMAENIGLIIKDKQEIYDTYTNIRLGTTYLKRMLKRFKGNYMLATAAYNAGPGRAARWSREFACQPSDIWVEQIPFRETRLYVQRVLTYTVIFDNKLGNKHRRLRLRDVGGKNCDATI